MDPSTTSSRNGYGRQLQDRLGSALHRLASLEESVSGSQPRKSGDRLSMEMLRKINADLQRAFVEVQEAAASYEHLRTSAARATQRADLLFLLSPIPCIVLDRTGVVLDANPAAARKVNLSHRYLVGKSFQLFVGSDREDFVKRLGSLERDEWVTKWTLRIRPRERGALTMVFAASLDSDDRVLAMLLPADAQATDLSIGLEHFGPPI